MPRRSLFSQLSQVRGSASYDDSLASYLSTAESAGAPYQSGTLAVVSGSATVTDSGNSFVGSEQNSFIVISSGDAAGVYTITSVSGLTAEVSPTPTGTDASASYNRHNYRNLEDDLNFVRTMVKATTGETNWYDAPSTPLSGKSDVGHDHDSRYYTETELDAGQLDNRYYTETEVDSLISTTSGTLQDQIDGLGGDYATDAELAAVSGSLQTQITTNATNITNNYNTLDTKIDTTSGTLQSQIDGLGDTYYTESEIDTMLALQDEFTELTDTISSYNAGRILFESADAVIDDANLTYVSGTQTLNVPNIDATGNISLDGTLGFDAGTTINEFVTTVDSSSTDDQAATAKAVYDHVDSVSGTLQSQITDLGDTYATDAELASVSGSLQSQITQNASDISTNSTNITNNYNTLDGKIDTTSGTLQTQIDNLGDTYYTETEVDNLLAGQDEFTELTDTISSYNAGRILFESADAVIDDANLTYVSGTQTFNAPNISVTTDLDVGGNVTVDGTFGFDAGTTVNEITTTVSGGTDDQVPTAAAVATYVDNVNTSLTEDIIWETVDTPSDQIRPKAAHQGKAIYSAGNLTIGGDLTVSGTTTTVHSEELTVADKVITVNAGEAGAGITGDQYAGIEVDRGSETNYMFVFDEVQDNFRVGISGSLQAVATREDSPTNNYIAYWDASTHRFNTVSGVDVSTILTTTDEAGFMRNDGDTATGDYNFSSGTLFIDDSERRVGIGTDSPDGLLDVESSGEVQFKVQDNYSSVDPYGLGFADNARRISMLSEQGTNRQALQFGDAGGTDTIFGIGASSDSGSSWNPNFVVTQPGNVGIGTDSPGATLDVDGDLMLEIGGSVNEIVASTGDISASSTDDQLATAKLIYDELQAVSTASGTIDHSLLANLDYASSGHTGFAPTSHTHTESDITDLGNYSVVGHSHTESDITDLDKYTTSEVDALLAAQDEFLELDDVEVASYNAGRVLFTTASGVTDNSAFTFDSVSGTLNTTAIQLGTGSYVNEIVTTVTSGTTDQQVPTAAAVWNLTEAAAAAVHTHYDVDASWSSNTVWTYGSGFTEVPEHLQIFVNGLKQHQGASNDCTAAINGGAIEITFTYNVYSDEWVNLTYIL